MDTVQFTFGLFSGSIFMMKNEASSAQTLMATISTKRTVPFTGIAVNV